MKIGILALQGAFKEHIEILTKLNVQVMKVRTAKELSEIAGIVLPGGESTVMGKLLVRNKLKEPLINAIKSGLPVWGTCAGMILLSNNHNHLNVMNMTVKRNVYGSQLGSFTVFGKVKGIGGGKVPLIFIRAPNVQSIGDGVEVLCEVKDRIVAVRQNNMLATSFHPEVTNDYRMHRYFIEMIHNRT